MDDQGSDAFTAWGPGVDNNFIGQFTSPSSLTPVAGIAPGILQDLIPIMLVETFNDSLAGTPWGGASVAGVPTYTDPNAQFTQATVTADSVGTFKGEAGPTDAPLMTAQFEVELEPGLIVVVGRVQGVVFDVSKEIQVEFQIPNELGLNNRVARFVVYAEDDARIQRFRSNGKVLTGLNWTPILRPPEPTINPPTQERHIGRPGTGVSRVRDIDRT